MALVRLANQKQFDAPAGVSLLDAAKHAGLVLEHSCRTGRCGTCKAHVAKGTAMALSPPEALQATEKDSGWILTCISAAETDLELDIEDLGQLGDITIKTLPCRIAALQRLSPDVVKASLRLPPNSDFRYLPGQYVNVIGHGGVHRSYSLANAPDSSGRLDLHIRLIEGGAMSAYWFEKARVNDLLRMEGPRGTFFLRDVTGLDLVLLATGTGIAPFVAMLTELATRPAEKRPRSVSLYWGGRQTTDIYWLPAFETLGLRFIPSLSRADGSWTGARGYVQQTLLESSPDLSGSVVYACGSNAMIESARRALLAADLSPKRFYSDAFLFSG